MDTKSVLREVGFTEGEIKVYLALVSLGSVTVGPIIDNSGVSNSKVYVLLEKLIQKGIVTKIVKERTKYFQAAPLSSLNDFVEKKKKELEKVREDLGEVMASLEEMRISRPSEEAKIYRGYKGILTAWLEAINSIPKGGVYYFLSAGYGEDEYLKTFFSQISLKLKEKKIKIRGIAPVTEKKLFDSYYSKLGYSMRYTDLSWPSDITVAGDFLLIFVWDRKEPVVYVLQSKVLVNSYRDFIEKLWKEKKKK